MDIRSIFESVGSDDPIRSAFESVGSNSFDEQKFQSWYAARAKKTGIDPDPDNPEHYYDYRAAFSAGVEPSIDPVDKQYHWSSEFKKEGHPRMVLDGVNTKTGQPVDPIRSAFEAAAGQSGPQLGPPVDVRALRGEPTRTITDAISAVVPQEPANQSFAQDKPVYTEPKLSPRPVNAGGPQLSQRPPQIEPKKVVDQGIRQASADTLNFLKALKAKEVRALEERLGADDPLVVKEKAKVWDDSPLGKFQKRLEVETTQDPLPRPEGFKGYVQDMVRALPQIGASVGATYVGGPAAGMAVTGSMIAGATERELSQARVDGKGRILPAVKDPERRWKAAIFNAAGQSFLEQLPMSRALAAWKPGAAAKSVIAEMSKTGALEWFTETIQKVPELMSSVWARGAGKSPDQMLDEFTEGVGQALKEGAYEGAVVAPVSMLIGGGGAAMGKIKAGPQPIQADEIETLAQAKAFGIVADKDMTGDLKAARADAIKQRDRLTALEDPRQDEIAVADLDNKIGLYDEALRNADNMQKVRQAFEDAAQEQTEPIGSQIVENEPQTEERLTDEPQQPPTLPEDQRTSEQPGEPAASGPGQQLDPVRSAFESAAGADAAVPTVPDLATTEDAISFGEAATDQQVSELERLREQTKARLAELNAVPVESRDWNAVSQEAFKSQLYREAIEASRGEHPSQLEAGRPMYWDGDGKTALQVTYHGTPYVWQPEPGFPHGRPRLDKIGTGEGMGVKGWGFYSADVPEVGDTYKHSVRRSSDLSLLEAIGDLYLDSEFIEKGIDKAVTELFGKDVSFSHDLNDADAQRAIKHAIDNGYIQNPLDSVTEASLYKLDIPDDIMDKLLDWDRPLSEQSEYVKSKLADMIEFWISSTDTDDDFDGAKQRMMSSMTGEYLYNFDDFWKAMDKAGFMYFDGDRSVSEYLASIGILGNRYLDGMSRRKYGGGGTYDYVIWDQPTLDRVALLERNGEKLDAMREATELRVTDQPPQLTSEQRQAVQKIYGAQIPILRTVFGKDLADRISVELKQMIDLGGANTDESLANWKARGVKPNTVLGATTFRGQRALMEISLAQDAKRQQWTFDHETFHIAAEWVLPPDQYATVLKAYGGNTEAAADGFARFMNGKSQPPEGIKKIFMQLKELLRRMGNFLRGSGFTSAEKIFGDIAAGGYAGKRRAGTGMYQGKAMSADEYAPQWYSQMQKVLEAKLPGSGTPQQMRDKALHEGMTLFNLDADNPGGMPPREPYARRPKSKNAIELPELTEMIKVLNSGKAPKLFQRMRDALGLFQHNDLAGIADVMIDPDLVIGQPIERAVIRLKGKTPAERKVSLVQQMQDFKDSVLSRYNVDPADMVFKSQYHRASGETHLSAIRKDPDVAAKVLSHELGHLDDWWAAAGDTPMVQGRGNILGRIAKLKGYINEYLAEYPGSPDEALTAADIGRLQKEAAKQKLDETTAYVDPKDLEMSGVTPELILDIMRGRIPGETSPEVYRFLQTADTQTKKEIIKQAMKGIIDDRVAQSQSKEGRMPTQKEINERFKELLRKEIIKRKLYERMVIMDELKNLTQEWKPFDLNISKKYTAYRHKSSELYADAVSVMLQEPELLKSVAPTFDKAMKMYASVRPDFTETLEGIRKDISGSQIGPRRLGKLYEMYERGEKVIADFYIRNRMEKRSLADTLFIILTDKNHGVLKSIRAAEKSGDPELIAKARKARYELEETQYVASEMSAYVTDTVKNVIDPMMEKGAAITDLGVYLFGRHVQANRKDVVSPGGHTSTTVEPMLEALEQKLGPEKYQAVKDAAEKYRKIREKYIIPRIEQSGIAAPELLQAIKARKEYARISVQHWLEEKHGKDITAQIYTPVGGALKAQKGTFSDSINAFTATLMQDISLLRSAHLNKAKTDLLDFLIDAGQVKPAEMKYDKGLGRMAPVRLEDPSRAHLSIMRDGTPYTYDVHRDITKSFEYSAYESQKATEVINALNAPLRRLLVSNNPVWMIRNIFRDFRTTIKNIPEARVKSLPELAKLYKQAYGEVWEYVWKNNASDDIDALLRGKAVTTDRVYGTKEMSYEDEAARIADEFNIQFNPELSKISQQRFKKARQILDVLDRFGRVSELGGKVAGYKFLKSQRDKGFVNPKTGKPRTDQEIYHVVRSRIGTPDFKRQGTGQIITNNLFMFSNVNKEGLRSALESFNEDRSAYVWKTVMYNILPKLILAAASAQIPWVKEVVDGLTDYQKDHYTVIPIPKRLVPGLGAMDSFAFLIPEDYEGQLAGALVNKIARGEFGGTKGAINEASQLVPYRWHPAISVGADLLTYYVNGMNPVDDFRGSHILPDSIYKAGGLDAHKEMGKYVWNNLGMRLFYNARQGELDPELAPLKEALQFPVLNWLSAIATVTNRGHAERYRRIIEPIRKKYARKMAESEGRIKGHINMMGYDAPRKAKVELYKTLKQEDLLPSEQNFNAFEKRYNRIKNKGKDDQRIVRLEYADTNEEKAALLSQYEMELGAEQYKKLLQNLRRDGIISQETLLKKVRGDKNGRNRRTNP